MRATLLLTLTTSASAFTANVVTLGGVQNALLALAEASGGILYFPPGDHAVNPFNLTSNTIMLLDFATLRAPTTMGAFALVPPLPSYGMGRDKLPNDLNGRYQPLIGIYHATNVTITTNSSGLIDGSGETFWGPKREGSLNNTPPHLIEVGWSSHVTIGAPPGSPLHALTLEDSPFWNIHLYDSDSLYVHDVSVFAPISEGNTDGADPDSSRNVLIERFRYLGGDDGVAIKSGWDDAGIRYNVPVENVTVRDSDITTRACCVCVGSEMSGGARNILASNIHCTNTGNAFYVKSAPGRGGFVTNFSFVDSVITGARAALGVMMTVSPPTPFPFPSPPPRANAPSAPAPTYSMATTRSRRSLGTPPTCPCSTAL
jgi:polygalacturonase